MTRIVASAADVPDAAFGARTLVWWGVLGFVLIEGMAFALAAGSYLFLLGHTDPWPPNHTPPGLLWSGLFVALSLLSEIPNHWTSRVAHAQNERLTQIGLVVMSVIGVVLVAFRWFELHALNVGWTDNAYGSIVWAILVLHTTHLLTDLADTVVLAVFTFTHEVDTRRFSDVADNCFYWHFVVLAWLPLYALVYWLPRVG
jgi:heme/copper-type cytochrome/quinol oxidase subunit 3